VTVRHGKYAALQASDIDFRAVRHIDFDAPWRTCLAAKSIEPQKTWRGGRVDEKAGGGTNSPPTASKG